MSEFVYGVSSSSPNVSKQIVKLNANNAINKDVNEQEVIFSLPRNGFCTKAYLVLTLRRDGNWQGDAPATWVAPRYCDRMSLRARGIEIRRAVGQSLIHNAVSCDGTTVDSRMRQIQGLMAIQPPQDLLDVQVVVDVGRALGFDCSDNETVQNSLDTLFTESLDVHCNLNSMTSVFGVESGGVSGLQDANLYCEYVQLSASDYDSFKSKNYSSSESTRRLVIYGEGENDVADSKVSEEVSCPIRYKGLIRSSFVQAWHPNNADPEQSMANITNLELYASGSLLWSCDKAGLVANKLFINRTVFSSGQSQNGLKPEGNDNLMSGQEINWALVSDNVDKASFFSGGLNTADLSNVELRVTTDNTVANGVISVSHSVMSMESIDGSSGLISISSRQ
jgi:hypothetical protein